MARGNAYNFPVVREALGDGRQYGFKSGLDHTGRQLGVKAGGYFPGNAARGLINHQSSVFLFDPETGRPVAMVGGNLLTALRTAAAAAISIDLLARADARVLGMVGAGHQAMFQLRAAAQVRRFERVIGWNRHPERLPNLAAVAAGLIARGAVHPLGNVIIGRHPGRVSADQITLFDGTGVGLQDLAVATLAMARAQERGLGVEVEV